MLLRGSKLGGVPLDKQTLMQYQYLIQEINQLEAEKQRLVDGVIGSTKVNAMPKPQNSNGDVTADTAARMADLATLTAHKLNQAVRLKLQIEQAISKLEPQERVLMRARYLEGKSWEQVAVDMHYTYRRVTQIHGKILEGISGI